MTEHTVMDLTMEEDKPVTEPPPVSVNPLINNLQREVNDLTKLIQNSNVTIGEFKHKIEEVEKLLQEANTKKMKCEEEKAKADHEFEELEKFWKVIVSPIGRF
jgi:chromosome segregation ATPase